MFFFLHLALFVLNFVSLKAFESLVSARIMVPIAAPSPNIPKEFVKYRCVAERGDVKKAVDRVGMISLKKWLGKAQGTVN